MANLWQDVRYGVRMLLKNPGFTVVAVIALALGVGANTAIFSVVNAVLLRPLPYEDPNRVVMVWECNQAKARATNTISPANYLDWRDQNGVFEQMAGFYDDRMNLTATDDPEEIAGQVVEVNFFSLLGVYPAIGRMFEPSEAQPGGGSVAILSDGLWRRRFGADAGVLGQKILLDGQSTTVIGVMPAGFQPFIKAGSLSNKRPELWLPLGFSPNARVRRGRYMTAMARLKPGVSLQQAQADMDRIAGGLEQQYPDFNAGWGVNLVPIQRQLTGQIRPALLILLGAVACVLLIACANVANLLLARAASRQKEIAIRTALGAKRGRVIRQLLTESLILAGLGGAAGFCLALWGVDALTALSPKDLLPTTDIGVSYRLLGFTFLASALTGMIFGIAPAIAASKPDLNETLKEGGKGSGAGARGHRLRGLFVVLEFAVALVLLMGSGLLIRSFLRLTAVDPGFNSTNLLTLKIMRPPSGPGFRDGSRVTGFFQQALERIEALPGVRSAGAVNFLPFNGLGAATGYLVEGRPKPATAAEEPTTDSRVATASYFRTMGIPLRTGRLFTEREEKEARGVVLINETMARLAFGDEDPIGKRVTIYMKNENTPSEIIGVVGDVKHDGLDSEPHSTTYWPHPEIAYPFMTIVVRTESDPLKLVPAIQSEIRALDKNQPIADIRTMEDLMSTSVARARFSMVLLSIFAAVALILSAVGIYGVMSYSVAQRTHEIGIRMALGAERGDVLRLVVGQGLGLAAAGVAVGLGAAFVLTRLLASLLFGVSATDPATFIAVPVLLTLATLIASFIPARRATGVDPMIALRYE